MRCLTLGNLENKYIKEGRHKEKKKQTSKKTLPMCYNNC